MSRKQVIEGLQILEKYDPDGWVEAGHDVIYGAAEADVSEEDAAKLEELGWRVGEYGWERFV